MSTTTLTIAVQKSGRLSDESLSLLKASGLNFRSDKSRLQVKVENAPISLYFLRDDDIPSYVADGIADVGLVGENVLLEKGFQTPVLQRLGFGKCRLSIAIPKEKEYAENYLNGKRIATSYPQILSQFLAERQLKAEIHEISGSVELAPSIGLSDAICDLVSSGSTLLSNGLKEAELVLESEAVLIANKGLSVLKQNCLTDLVNRMEAVKKAKAFRYIMLNAPNSAIDEVCKALPGMKSPTIMPLQQAGWCTLHSVVEEGVCWEKMQTLKDLGAQGILVLPIEKMML